MPVNTAQNEHWGMANAPDLGTSHLLTAEKLKTLRWPQAKAARPELESLFLSTSFSKLNTTCFTGFSLLSATKWPAGRCFSSLSTARQRNNAPLVGDGAINHLGHGNRPGLVEHSAGYSRRFQHEHGVPI